MIHRTCLQALFLILTVWEAPLAGQTRYYVRPEALGQNNGSSWTDAFTNLHDALTLAMPGDAIWVAGGIYKPSETGDRSAFFKMPSGVGLYGGFAGVELLAEERRPNEYPSILDGDLGAPGNPADNSYNLMYAFQPDSNTLIDGFTFRNANANKPGVTFFAPGANGGALLMDGVDGVAYAKLRNCRFERNSARLLGGAVCVNGGDTGSTAPVFEACDFVENSAAGGGACYRKGGGWIDRPGDFIRCRFERNLAATVGGAVFFRDTERSDSLDFVHCVFDGNRSLDRASALAFGSPRYKGASSLHFHDCDFLNHNTGQEMIRLDVVFDVGNFNLRMDSCRIAENKTFGMLVECEGVINAKFQNTHFYNNDQTGFSIAFLGLGDTVPGLVRLNNVSCKNGTETSFSSNLDLEATGFTLDKEWDSLLSFYIALFDRCVFRESVGNNLALIARRKPVISNCSFDHYVIKATLLKNSFVFLNCFFNKTLASSLLVDNPIATQTYKNSITYGLGAANLFATPEDTLVFEHCIIPDAKSGKVVLYKAGNLLNVNPMLMDSVAGDYRLHPCSPGVDAGLGDALASLGLSADLAGTRRIQGAAVDIGPYESPDYLAPVRADVQATCAGFSDGRIVVQASGGCPPYRVVWSNQGMPDTTLAQLAPGSYALTVSDSRGRTALVTAVVPISAPRVFIEGDSLVCAGASDAVLRAGVAGSEALPFVYRWSDGATTPLRENLAAGAYILTVTDALGCRAVADVRVETAPAPQVDSLLTPASTPAAQDGSIETTVSGPLSPYSYRWSNGATTAAIRGLSAGLYRLTLTDRESCAYVYEWRLRALSDAPEPPVAAGGYVRPNPAFAELEVGFRDSDTWRLFNASGVLVKSLSGGRYDTGRVDLSELPAGIYWYVFMRQGLPGRRGKLVLQR